MVKEKRILSYFIGWLVLGIIVCFIGIKNTYAATYTPDNFTAQLFDNINGSLSYQETNNEIVDNKNIYYYGFINNLVANSAGGAWGISSPIPLINNHTYSMTVKTQVVGCGTTQLSSINRIGIGPDMGFAKYAYENNQYAEELYSKTLNSNLLQFVFKAKTDSSYIIFPFSTSSSCSNREVVLYDIAIEDLGPDGITQNEINTSLNNQTNTINNSIQNSTNTITGEINDMEQSIIDSNKETQDVIKDQFNSCRNSANLLEFTHIYESNGIITKINENGSLNISGIPTSDWANLARNESIILKPGTYTFSTKDIQNFDIFLRLYTQNSGYIDYTIWQNQKSVTFTLEKEAIWYYVYVSRLNIGTSYNFDLYLQLENGSIATEYEEPNTEICSNKIDDTNEKLDGIQGALTDSSAPNTSGLENSAGWLPAGPLDSVLNLPLTMLNSLTNSLNKTCSPLNLTLPYVNKQIQIPCLSAIFAKITGVNGLWTWVGTIASVLILYNYLLNLYAWVDRILTLRAEFDEAMGADLANWGRL